VETNMPDYLNNRRKKKTNNLSPNGQNGHCPRKEH
jgi:hypothetical protein